MSGHLVIIVYNCKISLQCIQLVTPNVVHFNKELNTFFLKGAMSTCEDDSLHFLFEKKKRNHFNFLEI